MFPWPDSRSDLDDVDTSSAPSALQKHRGTALQLTWLHQHASHAPLPLKLFILCRLKAIHVKTLPWSTFSRLRALGNNLGPEMPAGPGRNEDRST